MKTYIYLFIYLCVISGGGNVGAQTVSAQRQNSLRGKIPDTPWRSVDFYFESNYQPAYGMLSELRARYNFMQTEMVRIYLGVASQRQDAPSNKDIIYIESISPLTGARFNFGRTVFSFAEYRHWVPTNSRVHTDRPDPRFGLVLGDYIPLGPPAFSEYYGELVAVPRVSNDLVATAWGKLGLRYSLEKSFYLDPYAEAFFRETPDPNLGARSTDLRLGLRFLYANPALSASAQIYQSIANRELQALFTLGGAL